MTLNQRKLVQKKYSLVSAATVSAVTGILYTSTATQITYCSWYGKLQNYSTILSNIYLLKVNNKNTRERGVKYVQS